MSLSAGEVKEITSGLPGSAAVPAIVNGTVAAPVYKDGRYSMVIYDLNAGTEKTYPLPDEVENLLSIQTHGTTAILTALENPKDYTSVITRIYHIPHREGYPAVSRSQPFL